VTPGLFGRNVAVEIGVPGTPGIRVDGLRVGFKVDHKLSKAASTATIRIWNTSPATRARMLLPGSSIRLLLGYGSVSRLVFWGQPVKGGISLECDGADQVFEVDAADGGRSYAATINVAFRTPTNFGAVLAVVLAETQWARGQILVPEATPLPHGIVLNARAADILDRLAAVVPPFGAQWFVRDDALYVVPKGQATPEEAPLLSSTAGNLIGSPVATKTGIKVRALIDATMRPARSFVVESKDVSGIYVAQDVTFTGDSGFANDYYMDISGKPVGAP
jgi:hypothetical protein